MERSKNNPEDPYDPSCQTFAGDMHSLDFSWSDSQEELDATLEEELPAKRIEFVLREEGTYNRENGHFLCDSCYIKAGMPSSNYGWVCP